MSKNFTIGGYSFRPETSQNGHTNWTVYRKGERTWSCGNISTASDGATYVVSRTGHTIDARPAFNGALALMCAWLEVPTPKLPAYLDRFPAEFRTMAEQAYQDGFEDGANNA